MKQIRELSGKSGDFAAILAGVITPLGFAPYNLFLLPILALTLLFFLWRAVSPWHAFGRGLLFGLGAGWGIAWIRISMMQFGGVDTVVAWLLTLSLITYTAIYPALLGYFVVRVFPDCNRVRLLLVTPAVWTLLEWVRSWVFTGFPWMSLGYSQIDSPLAGLAPFSGVYGVSWAAAFSSSLLVYAYLGGKQRALKHALPALIAVWGLSGLLTLVKWSHEHGEPIKVALVQANIPQEFKWDRAFADQIMERYLALSKENLDARLIVWPETAIPAFYGDTPTFYENADLFLAELENEVISSKVGFLLGIREYDAHAGAYYNSALSIGDTQGIYRKRHLVPFGEYLPLRNLLGSLLQVINMPMLEDFTSGGDDQEPIELCRQTLGVSICYEDVFPSEVRRPMPYATLLINLSNDAWFGDSIAPHQHLQIARMRALENGRYLLRATNTGISAVIDDKGKIIAQTDQFKIQVLRAQVQPLEGGTPYALSGNFQLFFIMFICLLIGVLLHYHWHVPIPNLPHFPRYHQ